MSIVFFTFFINSIPFGIAFSSSPYRTSVLPKTGLPSSISFILSLAGIALFHNVSNRD
jgi:hypothetical protein